MAKAGRYDEQGMCKNVGQLQRWCMLRILLVQEDVARNELGGRIKYTEI